jgi:hypothetical protein
MVGLALGVLVERAADRSGVEYTAVGALLAQEDPPHSGQILHSQPQPDALVRLIAIEAELGQDAMRAAGRDPPYSPF